MVADGEGHQEQSVDIDPLPIDGVPEALFAAEAFAAAPSAAGLTDLLDVLGGMDGLELGNIEGAYDIVTIDLDDTDRVLLSKRDDYIRGESNGMNQDENILWEWKRDGATSAPFRPGRDRAHPADRRRRVGQATLATR